MKTLLNWLKGFLGYKPVDPTKLSRALMTLQAIKNCMVSNKLSAKQRKMCNGHLCDFLAGYGVTHVGFARLADLLDNRDNRLVQELEKRVKNGKISLGGDFFAKLEILYVNIRNSSGVIVL